ATEDDVPLLVFDEVDANVGGETAHAVGERMRLLGQSHQVLCITHLAPVAAAANEHYRVSKKSEKGRTQTSLENLNQSKRIEELGRMLGGKVSAAKKHAEALLKALSKPKKK
ncbi:MAG: DNA repair protein RecN, partial [Verrucomicrobia bacterium]|nr:DNA repair protein RecN [Verrucomicrobiota bacterium]